MAKNNRNIWWGPPKNFADRTDERKISWLELFYDLVYVAAISQITTHFAGNPTWGGLGFSVVLFALIFWSWINGSLYHDLHGNFGLRTRLLTLWQMLSVAAVAITINNAYSGHHKSFALAFLVLESLIFYLWWSTGYYDPEHNKFNIYYRVHYGIAAVLFIVSYFTGFETAFVLWIIALLINLTPGITVAPVIERELTRQGDTFTTSAAVIERFGLFTIIVLGEVILGIVNGLSAVPNKTYVVWVVFFIAVLIAFLLWWVYFDMLAEQKTKKAYKYLQLFLSLHMPLVAALGIAGASINSMLSHIENVIPNEVYWIFCLSITVYLMAIVGLTLIMDHNDEAQSYALPLVRVLIGIAVVVMLLPFISWYIGPIALLATIVGLLIIPIVVGMQKWVRYKMFNDVGDE